LNQPSLKDLVLGQAKINENFTKKMLNNDKILENINSKLESLSATVQNQLSFNKTLEKQIAQLAAAIRVFDLEKTSGKPEVQFKSVNTVSMNYGKRKCQ
jgi:glutaredoxin 2